MKGEIYQYPSSCLSSLYFAPNQIIHRVTIAVVTVVVFVGGDLRKLPSLWEESRMKYVFGTGVVVAAVVVVVVKDALGRERNVERLDPQHTVG